MYKMRSMPRLYTYLHLHLPSKSTIHVGKYTIVPWIRHGNMFLQKSTMRFAYFRFTGLYLDESHRPNLERAMLVHLVSPLKQVGPPPCAKPSLINYRQG